MCSCVQYFPIVQEEITLYKSDISVTATLNKLVKKNLRKTPEWEKVTAEIMICKSGAWQLQIGIMGAWHFFHNHNR